MKHISIGKEIIALLICLVLFITGGCSSVKSDGKSASTDTLSHNEQRVEEPSAVQYVDYPSGADFIASIIDLHGSVEITGEMRESFNLFARDYRWVYLPDMDGYESFFEFTNYGDSYGFNNFAGAVFYVLSYMHYPEKMSNKAMEDAIQKLFVAKDYNYEEMPHQAYPKFANYENGYYSPWPEGAIDHGRMFYLLTAMDVVHDNNQDVYITVRAQSYYFEDTSVYEPGENEKWLAEKAKQLGMSDLQAAAKLIASGEIDEIEGEYEFETTIYIKAGGQSERGLNPQFVSNHKRYIE